jgi:hypothetical protein
MGAIEGAGRSSPEIVAGEEAGCCSGFVVILNLRCCNYFIVMLVISNLGYYNHIVALLVIQNLIYYNYLLQCL